MIVKVETQVFVNLVSRWCVVLIMC